MVVRYLGFGVGILTGAFKSSSGEKGRMFAVLLILILLILRFYYDFCIGKSLKSVSTLRIHDCCDVSVFCTSVS